MTYTSEGQDPFYEIDNAEQAIAALIKMYSEKTNPKPSESAVTYESKPTVTYEDRNYGGLEPSPSSESHRDSILDELELLLGQ